MIQLWPHQRDALAAIHSAIDSGREAGLISLPTGCGKTYLFCTLAKAMNVPTLIMVHTTELVDQAIGAFNEIWPSASIGVCKARRNEIDNVDVCIACVPSLRGKRLHNISPTRFGLVVCDEAHHARARTWGDVIQHFQPQFVLGTSATPTRADGFGLDEIFGEEPIFQYSLRQAITDGRLCQLKQFAVETQADLIGVSRRGGDFAVGELSNRIDTPTRNRLVFDSFKKHASDRKALLFSATVQHAENLKAVFCSNGVSAEVVSGKTPADERKRILKSFADGGIQVLANCAVLIEGFDSPDTSCILLARPTSSVPLFTQMLGRGMRLHRGKENLLALDFVDATRHPLITTMSLLGSPDRTNANGSNVLDVVDADLKEARLDEEAEKERRRQQQEHSVLNPLSWTLREVTPWPNLPDLHAYDASKPWHDEESTTKQIKYLRTFGVSVDRRITRGEAGHLINQCVALDAEYPIAATSRQKFALQQMGHWRSGLSKRKAGKLIGELKRTVERVPA